MKTYKVYEIINFYGSVEYVGQTYQKIEDRFYQHTKCSPRSGNGAFYGRSDVIINIVTTVNNRRDALKLESNLKKEHGLPQTELIQRKNAILKSNQYKVEHLCPHCNTVGFGNTMKRWHFDKCKQQFKKTI